GLQNGTPLTHNLTLGDSATYYLQLRAVDSGLRAGPWSDLQTVGLANVPPADITDFAAATSAKMELTWTAPGGDGAIGRLASYDIRYKTTPWSDTDLAGDFAAAATIPAVIPFPPKISGSAESVMITGLATNTQYYFAIRGDDGSGAFTSISTSSALSGSFVLV